MSRWPKGTRHAAGGVRVQRIGPQRSEVTGEGRGQEQCRKDPGWHNHPPKPQPQCSTQSQEVRGGGGGQMKNWKKNKTRWKLTAVNTMNQIIGERSKKKRNKTKDKHQLKGKTDKLQQRVKELLLLRKETHTQSTQEEQLNKHYFTQQVRREAKDLYRRSKIVGMDSAQAWHHGS